MGADALACNPYWKEAWRADQAEEDTSAGEELSHWLDAQSAEFFRGTA